MIATTQTAISTHKFIQSEKDRSRSREREKFRNDVIAGLSAPLKKIPSRYFYDSTGDELFRQIMTSPDYYVTRCEMEIFRIHGSAITRALTNDAETFEVVEFGAGDGTKTKRLLRKWITRKQVPHYRPVDISRHVLDALQQDLATELPELQVRPLHGDQAEVLDDTNFNEGMHRIFLMLGANIGNMDRGESVLFLRRIASRMKAGDTLMVGFDLKKDPRVVRRAYDDRAGVTRQFNLNLLHRMNMELGADIHIDKFAHEPAYDPLEGRAMSFLVSKEEQWVNIPGAPQPFHFKAWEAIHTETSHKYDMELIEAIARDSGLRITSTFKDKKGYFADVVLCCK
jgi:L-histidine Nalpha-methyltransferase